MYRGLLLLSSALRWERDTVPAAAAAPNTVTHICHATKYPCALSHPTIQGYDIQAPGEAEKGTGVLCCNYYVTTWAVVAEW